MEYVYAALLLHKLGKEVNEENVKKVVAATGAEVDDSKVKSLTASLKGVDIAKELESASLVAAAPAGPASSGEGGAKEEKKEEKPKEEKKAAAAEGLGALFG
jgi:large subunit ribosomal protein L12